MSDTYHCVVSWDIYTDDPDAASRVERQLKGVLKSRSWVRPMDLPLFIVKLKSPLDRRALKDELVQIARENPKTVRLIIGPPVVGSYGGWLPKPMWEKVRARTQASGGE